MKAAEREATIVRLYPLVRTIARSVAHRVGGGVDVDDLVGEGCLGLIAAVDSYDDSRGAMSLDRYVRMRIFGTILNGLRRNDRLSEGARRVLRIAERDRYATALAHGRMPSTVEMEKRHPKLRFARIAEYERRSLSIDEKPFVDSLVAPNWETDPARLYSERESRVLLHAALDKLPSRHRQVVVLYYFSGYRLQALAQRLSVSKQRIAQIRNDAIELVRQEVVSA